MRSLDELLDRDIPGKPSKPALSDLAIGVAVRSTETTDLIGKTRSVVEGLSWSEGVSEGFDIGELRVCNLGSRGPDCIPVELHNECSCERDPENER